MLYRIVSIFSTVALCACQSSSQLPSSYPHNYTGVPDGPYSPEWQKYFEVVKPLPNVTGSALPHSFAGSLSVNRPNHPNDTLFFWGYEREDGSLTAEVDERNDDPWVIWLNGGPGSSSFLGFFLENGPLHVTEDDSIVRNNYSWNNLADIFWIDQPVGTGYSTADSSGYVYDETQVGEDFMGFLANLVEVFPSLARRPLFLTGESYAGTFIPYIAKAYFSMQDPPVNLMKLAIGNGAIGNFATYEILPTVSLIETWPQIIGFDTQVYEYFRTQEHLCGYDLNLTYPQNGTFPTLVEPYDIPQGNGPGTFGNSSASTSSASSFRSAVAQQYMTKNSGLTSVRKRDAEEREERRKVWKRSLVGRANGTIDPYYGCYLLDELTDYAVNFTFPWSLGGFDVYDIPDALNPEVALDPSVFLNDNCTREAIHAPTSKDWQPQINYPFGSTTSQIPGSNVYGDPSIEAATFMTELATNASAHNVGLVFYSGNDDSLVAHRGTEVAIQNMTFGGIQGFTKKPSTPWYDDRGVFAGIIHQERNVTYALLSNAGHPVPEYQPEIAYVFLRDFILGSKTTGLVVGNDTIGGEDKKLEDGIILGTGPVFYGSGSTMSSTVVPSTSFVAWENFLATATAKPTYRA